MSRSPNHAGYEGDPRPEAPNLDSFLKNIRPPKVVINAPIAKSSNRFEEDDLDADSIEYLYGGILDMQLAEEEGIRVKRMQHAFNAAESDIKDEEYEPIAHSAIESQTAQLVASIPVASSLMSGSDSSEDVVVFRGRNIKLMDIKPVDIKPVEMKPVDIEPVDIKLDVKVQAEMHVFKHVQGQESRGSQTEVSLTEKFAMVGISPPRSRRASTIKETDSETPLSDETNLSLGDSLDLFDEESTPGDSGMTDTGTGEEVIVTHCHTDEALAAQKRRRPEGLTKLDDPPLPEQLDLPTGRALFPISFLRQFWDSQTTVPGMWDWRFYGEQAKLIITHSKCQPWAPEVPCEHTAILALTAPIKKDIFMPAGLMPLFLEDGDSCTRYRYMGHYKATDLKRSALDRKDIEEQIPKVVMHHLAWRVWRYRGIRSEYHKALAAEFFPHVIMEWRGAGCPEVMALKEEVVMKRFLEDESDTPLGLQLQWLYFEGVQYDHDFLDGLTMQLEDIFE